MPVFDYAEFPYHVITLGPDGHKADEHLVLSRHIIAANAGFNIMMEARATRTVLLVHKGRILRDSRDPAWSERQRRGDTSKYGYPPEMPAIHPLEPPWDFPLMELAGLTLETKCSCGRRLYPLRLMASAVGWGRTLRQVMPKLICRRCGQRPSAARLVADATANAPGKPGGDTWALDLR